MRITTYAASKHNWHTNLQLNMATASKKRKIPTPQAKLDAEVTIAQCGIRMFAWDNREFTLAHALIAFPEMNAPSNVHDDQHFEMLCNTIAFYARACIITVYGNTLPSYDVFEKTYASLHEPYSHRLAKPEVCLKPVP
jgi:hypothetical protein